MTNRNPTRGVSHVQCCVCCNAMSDLSHLQGFLCFNAISALFPRAVLYLLQCYIYILHSTFNAISVKSTCKANSTCNSMSAAFHVGCNCISAAYHVRCYCMSAAFHVGCNCMSAAFHVRCYCMSAAFHVRCYT